MPKFLDDKGESEEESMDNTFELIIIWLNRFLFIKLFEGQLISINGENEKYKILSDEKIKSFDDVQNLFFNVLGKKDREDEPFYNQFKDIPYLNSSLFERQEIERKVNIHDLRNNKVKLKSNTVIPKYNRTEIPLLQYLIDFLNSYVFGKVESSEGEYKKNSDIIDASVLGLIFEKINGYKDGSFYTPSTITEFMAKNVIEKTVIKKFNNAFEWNCETIEDIRFKLQLKGNIKLYKQANEIINSIHICDPAVGSGHFLVSVLNQLIYVKAKLGIIFVNGTDELLRDCDIYVQDDVLMVTDAQGKPFQYHKENKASQRIQETLFNEKRTIIEHCLFGVDLNDKAVQICCLRLWIELLKNAYYKDNVMETLPNIDINIKTGNSLYSKMPCTPGRKVIKSDARKNLQKLLKDYKYYVGSYRHENRKDRKEDIRNHINYIKNEVYPHIEQASLFNPNKPKTKYPDTSFDWGIEFPDLLTDDFTFMGFDIVIMNPPYIQLQNAINDSGEKLGDQYANLKYKTFVKSGDIYCLFFERAISLTVNHGYDAWICSDKWMKTDYGNATRKYLASHGNMLKIIEIGSGVFEAATVNTEITFYQKLEQKKELTFEAKSMYLNGKTLQNIPDSEFIPIPLGKKGDSIIILSQEAREIFKKMQQIGTPLAEWNIHLNYGIKTGLNRAFIISGKKKDELIAAEPKDAELIHPILRGKNIKRFELVNNNEWVIYIPWHFPLNGDPNIKHASKDAEERFKSEYPVLYAYMKSFYDYLSNRNKSETGIRYEWYALQRYGAKYWKQFAEEKIVWGNLCQSAQYSLADRNVYINAPANMIVPGNKYLLAILNSKLGDWYVRQFGVERNGGYIEYKPMFVEKLPVPEIPEDKQQEFIKIVDKILAAKKCGENTSEMEDQIDQMVYKLYKLTNKQISLIEKQAPARH